MWRDPAACLMEPELELCKVQHVALVADRLDVVLVKVARLEQGTLA